MKEILSQHGLKETDLDRECPQSVRDEVAVKLDDWEMIGRYLEFTLEKLRDINRENSSQELCRIALLDTWGKREGKRATYLKLADVLHRRQRCDLVEFLCAKLKSTLTLVHVPLSGSITSWEIPPANGQQHQVQQCQNYGSSSTGTKHKRLCQAFSHDSVARSRFKSLDTDYSRAGGAVLAAQAMA